MSLLPADKPTNPILSSLGFLVASALLSIPLLGGLVLAVYCAVALVTGTLGPQGWLVPDFVTDSISPSSATPSVVP